MNPTPVYAGATIILLASNALLTMLLMRYLSRDNTDLPLKTGKIAELAGWLTLIYLVALASLAMVLAFLAK